LAFTWGRLSGYTNGLGRADEEVVEQERIAVAGLLRERRGGVVIVLDHALQGRAVAVEHRADGQQVLCAANQMRAAT
jgi:hypothetical protein